MRRTLLPALLLALGAGIAPAQQAEPLPAHVVVPQRRAFTVHGQFSIQIERVRARVQILEQTATTTLDVTVINHNRRQTEAILLLPVPAGAVVHSFDFKGGAPEPTARLLKKEEARRIYNTIVSRSRDPALLEFAGHNLVRSSVFPVDGHTRQTVRITYNHLLPVSGNRVDYVLPRSEALDVRVPWEVFVDIKSKKPISTVYSPSHETTFKRHGPQHMTLKVKDKEPGAFRLSYLRSGNGVTASLFAYPDPKIGGGYFLLLAGVPVPPSGAPRMKREVTLVLDRSGSMAGKKLEQARAAALQVIEGLRDGEAFNLIDYGNDVSLFAAQPVIKSAVTMAKARKYLESLRPRGGTNIHDALVEALRQKPVGKMLPLVLFLTDGLPTIGQTAETSIRRTVRRGNPHKRRVFTFGVGHDVNAPLLDRIAETTRGRSSYVLPDEHVELKVAEVFRRLQHPMLANLKITTRFDAGAKAAARVTGLTPARLPDLFEGDQLVLLGKYHGETPWRFTLTGDRLDGWLSFDFDFDLRSATTRNAFVPRLWASRRIAVLVDQIRQATADAGLTTVDEAPLDKYRELVDEVLRLSTEFGILTEYTSFLATEGTDLSDWDELNLRCGNEIDTNAVRKRWGEGAVSQAKNFKDQKASKKLNYRNSYLDQKLKRVEITGVQQIQNRALFRRGQSWIDGRIIAERKSLTPDRTVVAGTPEFKRLLDEFIKEGCQGVLSFHGSILIRFKGQTVLIKNGW